MFQKYLVSSVTILMMSSSVIGLMSATGARAADVAAAPASAAPPAPGSSTSSSSNQLEEIVVTAEKRSENISRVGLAITAFSGFQLQNQQIKDIPDLAQIVPGLSYSQSATNTPVYTLRGVGFNESSLAAYSDVAIYVDQVPLPFPALTTEAGLDLERLEILKGPQGILFGQNATGGAINYIANKPTDHLEAGFDLGYGRFNDVELQGFVSGPITDTVKARLALLGEHADGWQYSYTRSDTAGEIKKFAGRLLVDWDPTDRLKFELNVNGWINQSDPQMAQLINVSPQLPAPIGAALLAYPLAPRDDRAADWSPNLPPHGDEFMFQTSLRADYSFTDDLTLTSISSWIRFRRNNSADTDGVTFNDDDLGSDEGQINNFDQELRIANASTNDFRWMFGGNYEFATVKENELYLTKDATASQFFGENLNTSFYANQIMRNYAAFTNVDYDILPELTVKAGARFTQSDRESDNCTYDPGDGGLSALYTGLIRALGHPKYPGLPIGACASLNPATNLPLPIYEARLNQPSASWRVGFDYKPTPDLLFYVNVAKGYKAGSIGTISASSAAQYSPVRQESVLDYEGGFKAKLLDHSMELDGAGFHYDYKGKQVRGVEDDIVFGLLDNLVNIPVSSIDGGELSLTWAPIQGLTLSGSATYLHSQVEQYTGLNTSGVLENFAGAPLPFTPDWQYSFSADYSWTIMGKYVTSVGATVTHKSMTHGTIGQTSIENIDPYTLLNLRASIDSEDGAWRLSLYGKNVTNEYYWTNAVHAYDTDVRYTGRPVTYGAVLSYRFHGGEEEPAAAATYTPPPVVPVTAPNNYLVFFDFNKSDLTPQAVTIVDQAAKNAETTKVTQLTVTGHTDTVGSDAYNMRLSRRRAESVASQLEKDGIPSSEIEIVAKGKRDLLVPTADGVKEPQNRRVQIVFSGASTS
jgi:iron complex outermembrane receptor protein